MSDCPITGEAIVRQGINRSSELEWLRADPEIHASTDLLNGMDDPGRAFFDAKYEIGEPCTHNPHTVHARLREETP